MKNDDDHGSINGWTVCFFIALGTVLYRLVF